MSKEERSAIYGWIKKSIKKYVKVAASLDGCSQQDYVGKVLEEDLARKGLLKEEKNKAK